MQKQTQKAGFYDGQEKESQNDEREGQNRISDALQQASLANFGVESGHLGVD